MKALLLFLALCGAALSQSLPVGAAVFSGSGLNDAISGGSFLGSPANHLYTAQICTAGIPDTIKTSRDGGTATTCRDLTSTVNLTYPAGRISAASWSDGRATLTVTGHGLSTGALVTITGTSPGGYNVSGRVAVVTSANTFSVPLDANPGPYVSGGLVTASDGVTLTFATAAGHRVGAMWAVTSTASGSSTAAAFMPRGQGAQFRSVQEKLRDFVSVLDFGAIGNYNWTTHSGYDNCAAFTAAAKIGGDIYFPAGQFYSSCGISQGLPSLYYGAGKGDDCATSRTCLIFPAGVTGIANEPTARGSGVRNLWLRSLATKGGAGDGIRVRDSWFSTFNVGISDFGRDGIHADTDNVDDMNIDHTYFVRNHGDGWHCGVTTDCNVIVVQNSGAQGNGGIGFHQETGGVNWFSNLNTSGNGVADFDLNGISLFVNLPYCEAAGAFRLRAVHSRVTSPYGGGCTITNLGGPSNTIISGAGEANRIRFGPDTWPVVPVNPTVYEWRSGHLGNGVMSLWDDTNSTTILHYDPAKRTITFDKAVAYSTPNPLSDTKIAQSSSPPGLVLYKGDSAGAGTPSFCVRMDGTDEGHTEKPYAQFCSAIEWNTPGAEAGSFRIKTAQGGTLTEQLVVNGHTHRVELNGNVVSIDPSGNVFANGAYVSGEHKGLTYVAHLMGANGVTPCAMTFTGGLLTNTTC